MDTDNNKPEIKIIRIDSNFSPSQNHIVSYDILKKSVTITNIERPVDEDDRYITVTVTFRMKV